MRTAHSEQIRVEAASIRRYATVAAIKRRAFDLTAPIISDDIFIADTVGGPHRSRTQPTLNLGDAARWLLANGEAEPVMPRQARPLFIFPAKHTRLFMRYMCLRAR
jgi:hypothetical protein